MARQKTTSPAPESEPASGELATQPGNGALGAWADTLADYADEAVALEPIVGGPFLGTRGCMFSIGEKELGSKLNLIVLAYALENAYYVDKFNANKPASPVCYAFGTAKKDLVPHEACTEPQCEHCEGCPQNQWNTSDTGRGKACRNIRRLACVLEEDAEDISVAPVEYLRIPVTSVDAWKHYVAQLATDYRRPPFAVLTEISLVPDPDVQMRMVFKPVGTIDEPEDLQALVARHKEAQDTIGFAYPDYQDAPPSAAAAAAPSAAPQRAARRSSSATPSASAPSSQAGSAPAVPARSRLGRARG